MRRRNVPVYQVGHPVLGTGPHFPLGMIKSHVADHAGFGLCGFFCGKRMTGMAVLAIHAVSVILPTFGQSFGFIGQSQRMASAATFLPFDIGFRLHMGIGHGFKGNQAEGMFAGGETETETDGKETSASVCVGINRCTSEHNRGIVCWKTEGPGLCGGVG